MSEWQSYLDWLPVISGAVAGFFAGQFYAKYRYARTLLGAVMFILYKIDRRGVFLSPYDKRVIQIAIDYLTDTR